MTHKTCSTCILDTSLEDIKFDKDGVCNYCRNYKGNIIESKSVNQKKDIKLRKIVRQIKLHNNKNNNKYDCLIGISGGADSCYLTYYVVNNLGLKPLLFHVDAGWNSNISSTNIEMIVEKYNLDLITHVVDWEEMKDLHLSYFKAGVPSIDTIQDHAFFGALYNYVEKNNIKFVLTGGNYSTEFIRPPLSWAYHASDARQIKDIHKKFGQKKINYFPYYDVFRSRIYLRILKGVKVFNLLDLIDYNKEHAIAELKKNIGWLPYGGKHHESRFTKFFENYWSLRRFGHDRRKLHFSSLILSGQMTRKDALQLISKKPDSEEQISKDVQYVCNKLDITLEELDKYLNMPKRSFKDYKSHFKLIYIFTQILRVLKIEKRIF